MTVLELIRRSLRLIGALGVGEAPSAEETSDCILALNQLISSWSLNALTVYTKLNSKYTLTNGLPYFTWGIEPDPLAVVQPDFNSPRPDTIFRAYRIDPGGSYELSQIGKEHYDAISEKNAFGVPDRFYYEPDYPWGKVYLYPNPDSSCEIEFSVFKKIDKIEYPDDEIMYPPGWDRALAYNLALEVAPEFGLMPSELVVKNAMESLANAKRINIKPKISQTEISSLSLMSGGSFNINTGEG